MSSLPRAFSALVTVELPNPKRWSSPLLRYHLSATGNQQSKLPKLRFELWVNSCLCLCETGGGAVQAEQPGEAGPDSVLQDRRRRGQRHLRQPGKEIKLHLYCNSVLNLRFYFWGLGGCCVIVRSNKGLRSSGVQTISSRWGEMETRWLWSQTRIPVILFFSSRK